MQETWVQSLGILFCFPLILQFQSLVWEDLLEKKMATHSSLLAWEIPWTEEPTIHGGSRSGYNPWCCKGVGHDLVAKTTTSNEPAWLPEAIHIVYYIHYHLSLFFLFDLLTTGYFLLCEQLGDLAASSGGCAHGSSYLGLYMRETLQQ